MQPTKALHAAESANDGMGYKDPFPSMDKSKSLPSQPAKVQSAAVTSHNRKREAPAAGRAGDFRFRNFELDVSEKVEEKPAKRGPKRSLAATIERMEKHKVLERKRREKTKELMSELQALIPTVENVEVSCLER